MYTDSLSVWKNRKNMTHHAELLALAVATPEGDLDRVLVTGALVERLARLERRNVQMQGNRSVGLARVFHTVQTKFV